MDEQIKTATPTTQEQYEIIFKNGALLNLKQLAKAFGVAENELKQVVSKGINLLTLVKDAKSLVLEDKNGNRFFIDVKKL